MSKNAFGAVNQQETIEKLKSAFSEVDKIKDREMTIGDEFGKSIFQKYRRLEQERKSLRFQGIVIYGLLVAPILGGAFFLIFMLIFDAIQR